MSVRPFCNRCLETSIPSLRITSCRHVICTECYAKYRRRCAYCRASCKVLPFEGLPEEMSSFFKPFIPPLKKLLKIARFQMLQRSIWAKKRKFILEEYIRKKKRISQKKRRIQELKQRAKMAIAKNRELKQAIQNLRRTFPTNNPFELNTDPNKITQRRNSFPSAEDSHSSNNNSHEYDRPLFVAPPPQVIGAYDSPRSTSSHSSSSRSSLSDQSSSSSSAMNVSPKTMSSTVNTASFFNGSHISASSSFSSTTSNSSGKTDYVRQLLKNATIRSPAKITQRRWSCQ